MNVRLFVMAAAAAVLAGSVSAAPLADRHVARGVMCDKCHAPQPPAVKFENCTACHGGVDKLISRNAAHAAVKSGANCGMCHKAHKE